MRKTKTGTAGRAMRGAMSVALCGALALGGGAAVLGAQMVAPSGVGVVQQAQAKTYKGSAAGTYQFALGKQSLSSIKLSKTRATLKLKTSKLMYYTAPGKESDAPDKLKKGTYTLKLQSRTKWRICKGTKVRTVSLKKFQKRAYALAKRKTDLNTYVSFTVAKGKTTQVFMFDCEPD